MKLSLALLAAASALLAGCGGDQSSQTAGRPSNGESRTVISSSSNSKVDRAATVAKAIQADPAHSEDVLRRNGMTEDEFEALLYDIAADPEMSREYNARMGG